MMAFFTLQLRPMITLSMITLSDTWLQERVITLVESTISLSTALAPVQISVR